MDDKHHQRRHRRPNRVWLFKLLVIIGRAIYYLYMLRFLFFDGG